MKAFTLRSASILFLVFCIVFTMNAQEKEDRKVTINITTKEGGKTTITKKVIDLEDGEDVEKILEELGILGEVGDISEGQVIEINIIRKEDNDVLKDMEFGLFMNDHKMKFFECDESRPFLGVYVESNDSDEIQGALITGVIDGSAAAETDLEKGDVITSVNSIEVTGHESLVDALYANEPGDEVKIAYVRSGKKSTTKVELGEKEQSFSFEFDEEWIESLSELESLEGFEFDFDDENSSIFWSEDGSCEKKAFLGITNHSARTDKLENGVAIEEVVSNSTAENMGLQAGDVVLSINGNETNDFKQLADVLSEIEIGSSVTVSFMRDGKNMTATEEIGEKASRSKNYIFAPGEMDDIRLEYREELEGSKEEMETERARMHEEMQHMMVEVERMRNGETDVITKEITVVIIMSDISEEEAEEVNSNSEEKISIANDLEVDDFNYYPNPNRGVFDLTFSVPETGTTDIVIFDQKGKKVYSERLIDLSGSYNNQIDIAGEASGTYFMQITQNGKTFSKKIVKN